MIGQWAAQPANQAPQIPMIGKVGTAYGLFQAAQHYGGKLHDKWEELRNYTVTVRSDDAIYDDVQRWLLEAIPPERAPRALVASSRDLSSQDGDYISSSDYDEREQARLVLAYDDKRNQEISLGGHVLKVSIERAEDATVDSAGRFRIAPDSIKFTASSRVGRDAIIAHLRHLVMERGNQKRQPVLWLLNSWGSWQRRQDLPLRDLSTVVLAKGQMERLVDDLRDFLAAESDYVRRGIPWHRGYLLHGSPGTGKTSIVKALAHHFGLDLWYAPLGDLTKDSNLLNLLAEVRPRSILLLEDVDVWSASHDRQAEQNEVSMSGLLNALDGVATPHGLITVMTTNHRDVLDDAVLRPGRVDIAEEIGMATSDQIERLFKSFYGRWPRESVALVSPCSPADVMEVFKQHMTDPESAETAMMRWLRA